MIKIAVDAMGGDFAPTEIIGGVLKAIKTFNDVEIVLFGDVDKIGPMVQNVDKITLVDTKHYLDMGETDPIGAYRKNREHSLFKAIKSVKDGLADACVTAGPTQAVVTGGQLILKKLPQMRRMAIAPIIPSLDGKGKVLMDSGANLDLRPEHLVDYAIFASIFAKKVLKRDNPKVGLINIGSEVGKGRDFENETYELLKANKDINFIGNVEPKELFITKADILVTDGFTGNILMKSVEGAALGMGKILKREINSSFKSKIGALFMRKSLKSFKKSMDASEIGGALLMGLNQPLIKAHGNSNAHAFFNAIRQAKEMVENNVILEVVSILSAKEADDN